MNTETALFAIKVEASGQTYYAKRIPKTQDKSVMITWNPLPHNATTFTFEEVEAIQTRHKHRNITLYCVGGTQENAA